MIALNKGKISEGRYTDIRPIVVGETLRRLTGKCLCSILRDKFSTFFQPSQFGVVCKAGVEKVVHKLRKCIDDGWMSGDFVVCVVRALHLIEELGPHLGLFINYPKCEVFSRNGCSLFPASVKSSFLPNLEILGAPIGDLVHCSRFFAEKHNLFKVLLRAISDVAAVDLHVAISLLRMCGGYCKLVHLARTTPTILCEDSLKFFDEEMRLCFSSCVAIDVPDPQW